jgi:hypothetical protein
VVVTWRRLAQAERRQIGRWVDYAYGENVYLVLSLVAKSVLAWQIFAGSLAG